MRLGLLLSCGLATSVAFAQPAPTDPPPPPEAAIPLDPPPPPPIAPQPPQPPVVREEPIVAPAAIEPDRPIDFSIGIGVGYQFPTSLTTPNTTSVRFRFPNKLTLEPALTLATASREVDVGTTQAQSATQVGVGALARFGLFARKRTELQLLGAVNINRLSEDPNDQFSDDETETTTVTVNYGLAVGFWVLNNLELNLSATNPIVSYNHLREVTGPEFITVTDTTSFGLIWNPSVTFMIHLYY